MSSLLMSNEQKLERIAELDRLIELHYTQPQPETVIDPLNTGEVDDEYRLEDERDTLLAQIWTDENGLLIGALDYIREHREEIKKEGRRIIYQKDLVDELGGEDSRQIGLFIETDSAGIEIFQVDYQIGPAHYATITQHYATLRVTENGPPYKVYRPYLVDGKRVFKLVHEVVVTRHVPDATPATLYAVFEEARSLVWSVLNEYGEMRGEDLDDLFNDEEAPRPYSTLHEVETTEPFALWLKQLKLFLNGFTRKTPWDEILDSLESSANMWIALLESVDFKDTAELDYEDPIEEVLEKLDSRTPGHEISMY